MEMKRSLILLGKSKYRTGSRTLKLHQCHCYVAPIFSRSFSTGKLESYQNNTGQSSNVKYCVNLVRAHDKKKYFAGLLMPKEQQGSYFTILAFNVETAIIRDSVHGNEQAGKVRMQWWRDAIDSIYSGNPDAVPHHPVIKMIYSLVLEHNLTRRWFDRLIDARENDLISSHPPMDMSSVERYAEHTMGSALYLCLESAGVRDSEADHAASHIGKALGISTLLFAVPFLSASGVVNLPVAEMTKNGIRTQDVLTYAAARASRSQTFSPEKMRQLGDIEEGLINTIYDVASIGHGHLEHARDMIPKLPEPAIKLFLPATIASQYLDNLERKNFQVFDPDLMQTSGFSDVKLQFLLLKNSWGKKF